MARGSHAAIIGRGLIGAPLAESLIADGWTVKEMGRSGANRNGFDLAIESERARLHEALSSMLPTAIVLVHGPTDIDWCEANKDEAVDTHAGTVKALADLPSRIILVSTDNVFDGERFDALGITETINPINAYGRAKATAEQHLLFRDNSVTIRVSVVYGWGGRRRTFASKVYDALSNGRTIDAPTDQYYTPVFLDDVVMVLNRLTKDGAPPRLVHLGGPQIISRYDFAREIAGQLQVPSRYVRPILSDGTSWALRPRNSCLETSWLPDGLVIRGPSDGVAEMLGSKGMRVSKGVRVDSLDRGHEVPR